jgi:hypothetical protein
VVIALSRALDRYASRDVNFVLVAAVRIAVLAGPSRVLAARSAATNTGNQPGLCRDIKAEPLAGVSTVGAVIRYVLVYERRITHARSPQAVVRSSVLRHATNESNGPVCSVLGDRHAMSFSRHSVELWAAEVNLQVADNSRTRRRNKDKRQSEIGGVGCDDGQIDSNWRPACRRGYAELPSRLRTSLRCLDSGKRKERGASRVARAAATWESSVGCGTGSARHASSRSARTRC